MFKSRALKRVLADLVAALLLISLTLPPLPAAAGPELQWADLVTGVDANGNIVTSHLYGYYADIEGVGEAFVVCDPATGKETGEAYVPGAKIGDRKVKKLVGYNRRKDLDWDHPKQVNPPGVALMMPNIPTSTQYDWDYYKTTGKIVKKTINQFGWPMSYSFARMVPGSDPDYWLIVATLQNPNPYPITVNANLNIRGWQSFYSGGGTIGYNGQIPLGPNETKYLLLNRGQKNYFLAEELWVDWPEPGYSEAYYSAGISSINDPDYPDMLKSGDRQGFFAPYVRWDGTDPTVVPLVPMRLAFNFSCYAYERNYNSDPRRSRGWPQVYGHAEYNPDTGLWSVGVSYYGKKRWHWTDQEWQAYLAAVRNNAGKTLTALFARWYPKVPFWCAWWDDSLLVDADTGYYTSSYKPEWPSGRPSLTVRFRYLEPVPPSTLPPGAKSLAEIYGPWWWLANVRYGGWLYQTSGSWSNGYELPAPVLTSYGYRWNDPIWEGNYRRYSVRERDGDTDDVYVPDGTGVYRSHADPRYYDTDWMDVIPVVEATPMFIEKYTFVATDGNFGYLKKDVVPGYLLESDNKDRPVLNVVTQPIEIRARCGYADWRSGYNGYRDIWREWRWTPSTGWQYLGETVSSSSRLTLSRETAVWELTFNYNSIINGNNPEEFQISWTGIWGGVPSLYWPGADTFRAVIASMADWEQRTYYSYYDWEEKTESYPRVDYVNVDSNISLPVMPSLGPRESKWFASYEKNASTRFYKSPNRYESWDAYQNRVLGEIVSKVIQSIFGSQEEAVFNGGGRFVMTPTFKTGEGGIVCGAQKYLVHRRYTWDSEDDWYVWDHISADVIGFPGADVTLCSYVTSASPTDGLVVQGGDEYLGTLLSRRWNEIPFYYGVPNTQRQWRFYYGGQIYPPPYPED